MTNQDVTTQTPDTGKETVKTQTGQPTDSAKQLACCGPTCCKKEKHSGWRVTM